LIVIPCLNSGTVPLELNEIIHQKIIKSNPKKEQARVVEGRRALIHKSKVPRPPANQPNKQEK